MSDTIIAKLLLSQMVMTSCSYSLISCIIALWSNMVQSCRIRRGAAGLNLSIGNAAVRTSVVNHSPPRGCSQSGN